MWNNEAILRKRGGAKRIVEAVFLFKKSSFDYPSDTLQWKEVGVTAFLQGQRRKGTDSDKAVNHQPEEIQSCKKNI